MAAGAWAAATPGDEPSDDDDGDGDAGTVHEAKSSGFGWNAGDAPE